MQRTNARAANPSVPAKKEAKGRVMVFAVSRRFSRRQTTMERDALSVLRFDDERLRGLGVSPLAPPYPLSSAAVRPHRLALFILRRTVSLRPSLLAAAVVSFELIRHRVLLLTLNRRSIHLRSSSSSFFLFFFLPWNTRLMGTRGRGINWKLNSISADAEGTAKCERCLAK